MMLLLVFTIELLIVNCIKPVEMLSCATLGNPCSTDSDCCSGDCELAHGETSMRCIRQTEDFWGEPVVMSLMSKEPQYCTLTGHFCIADNDCCSGTCKDVIGNDKLHYCDWEDTSVGQKKNHPRVAAFSSGNDKITKDGCIPNGGTCISNDACCSKKCFFHTGNYKNTCIPKPENL